MSDNHHNNYLTYPKGIMSWLLTLDHKRIGLMYLFGGMFFFFLAGVIALIMRFVLATPEADFVTNDQYNSMYTLHGAIMIFLFIIPAIPGALGNILLPLMLGARDVAFPRLNLFISSLRGSSASRNEILAGSPPLTRPIIHSNRSCL